MPELLSHFIFYQHICICAPSCSNGKNRKDREKERGHCHPVGPSKGDRLTQRHDDIWKEWLGKRQPSWVVPAILLPDAFEIFEEGAVQESRTKEEVCLFPLLLLMPDSLHGPQTTSPTDNPRQTTHGTLSCGRGAQLSSFAILDLDFSKYRITSIVGLPHALCVESRNNAVAAARGATSGSVPADGSSPSTTVVSTASPSAAADTPLPGGGAENPGNVPGRGDVEIPSTIEYTHGMSWRFCKQCRLIRPMKTVGKIVCQGGCEWKSRNANKWHSLLLSLPDGHLLQHPS
ncbi:hypothetical protein PABG_01984 [Paracoccidioides brasiliensis Pb03]|nr:hypothetical protein PABG_01984 [Paracoccidioides brasiliensis Pb03]